MGEARMFQVFARTNCSYDPKEEWSSLVEVVRAQGQIHEWKHGMEVTEIPERGLAVSNYSRTKGKKIV
jgi:hypothetical protein